MRAIREEGCYGWRVDLTARVEGLKRQADSVGYKVKQDCESLRRTARFSRANGELGPAMELERIANEREAEMTSINRILQGHAEGLMADERLILHGGPFDGQKLGDVPFQRLNPAESVVQIMQLDSVPTFDPDAAPEESVPYTTHVYERRHGRYEFVSTPS